MRRLVLDRERIDQALRVFDLGGDHAREGAFEMRIVGIEAAGYEFRMSLNL